jgi:hypothetical protein
MTFKERFEQNFALGVLSVLLAGFIAGFGAYRVHSEIVGSVSASARPGAKSPFHLFQTGLNLGRSQIYALSNAKQTPREIERCRADAIQAGFKDKIVQQLSHAAASDGDTRYNTITNIVGLIEEELNGH